MRNLKNNYEESNTREFRSQRNNYNESNTREFKNTRSNYNEPNPEFRNTRNNYEESNTREFRSQRNNYEESNTAQLINTRNNYEESNTGQLRDTRNNYEESNKSNIENECICKKCGGLIYEKYLEMKNVQGAKCDNCKVNNQETNQLCKSYAQDVNSFNERKRGAFYENIPNGPNNTITVFYSSANYKSIYEQK